MKRLLTFLFFYIFFIYSVYSVHNNKPSQVRNYTQYEIEELVNDACKVLDLDSVTILIRYANIDVKATVIENIDNEVYTLFIRDDLYTYSREFKEIIVHELIHVKQYYLDELVKVDANTIQYKGKQYSIYKQHGIEDREYEKEAYRLTNEILKAIRKLK